MAYSRYRSVNLGRRGRTLERVGYALAGATAWGAAAQVLDPGGNPTGVWGATITFPTGYAGPLLWTSDTASPGASYAEQDINPGEDERTDVAGSSLAGAVWTNPERTLTGLVGPTPAGPVAVDHNYGGADAFRYLRGDDSSPISGGIIQAYYRADYQAGRRGMAYLQDQVMTAPDGRWTRPMYLFLGSYTLLFFAEGIRPSIVEVDL